jgi:hypothetical protein
MFFRRQNQLLSVQKRLDIDPFSETGSLVTAPSSGESAANSGGSGPKPARGGIPEGVIAQPSAI